MIILSSLGIKNNDITDSPNSKLLNAVTRSPITQDDVPKYLIMPFLRNTPLYLIGMLFEGYLNENSISAYSDFFGLKIDNALCILKEETSMSDSLASDILEALKKTIPLHKENNPSFPLLNDIWNRKVLGGNAMSYVYSKIVISSMSNLDLNEIISFSMLSLSEEYILKMLTLFGINNEKGDYDLEKFQMPYFSKGFDLNNRFGSINVHEFDKETLGEILTKWLNKFEDEFSNLDRRKKILVKKI